MKIVILDGYTANPGDLSWDAFEKYGEVSVYDITPNDTDRIAERVGDAEVIFVNKVQITAAVMDRCPNLRFINEIATGYNNVDVAAAAERGIIVSNIPAYSTASVSQLAIALLLEICLNVGMHDRMVHGGVWEACPYDSFSEGNLLELAGKTMGVIGFGKIGMGVGRVAAALGMKVIAYSRSVREEGKALAEYVSLDELLERADVISLNCPLFPETAKIINKDTIAKMKDGVIIINTGRGGLVDEDALADALATGKVYAAGVDVVSQEPIRSDNPLLQAPNCYMTPHFGWRTRDARIRLMQIAEDNLKAYLDGSPINRVN